MDNENIFVRIWNSLGPFLTRVVHTPFKHDLELPVWLWLILLGFLLATIIHLLGSAKRWH